MRGIRVHARGAVAGLALAVGTITGCARISPQQEADMGLNYSRQINAKLPIVRDPETNAFITRLGTSLTELVDDQHRSWRFAIVDDPAINAFAVPGGYVYVNKGLIMKAQTLSQLAGVVGHEIAHVTQRHSVQQMEKGQKVGVGAALACVLQRSFCQNGGGDLLNLGATAIMAKFSRGDEAEADQYGVKYVLRGGIDPRGLPEMFEIMLAERSTKGGGSSAGWLASHPVEEDRIAATRAAIAQLPVGSLDGLTRDTPAYQAFRARLRSLPQTPKP